MSNTTCGCIGIRHFCGLPTPTRERVQIDARDAEIERLRAGIKTIESIAGISGDEITNPDYALRITKLAWRLGKITDKCDELLKGGE